MLAPDKALALDALHSRAFRAMFLSRSVLRCAFLSLVAHSFPRYKLCDFDACREQRVYDYEQEQPWEACVGHGLASDSCEALERFARLGRNHSVAQHSKRVAPMIHPIITSTNRGLRYPVWPALDTFRSRLGE